MTMNQTIRRRALLLASPAMATIGILPVAYAAEADAPVDGDLYALFADWRASYELATSGDDNCDVHCERLWAIEDRMAALCPATLAGFAMKLLVMTSYDEFDLDSERAKTLFADAIAITQLPPPAATELASQGVPVGSQKAGA